MDLVLTCERSRNQMACGGAHEVWQHRCSEHAYPTRAVFAEVILRDQEIRHLVQSRPNDCELGGQERPPSDYQDVEALSLKKRPDLWRHRVVVVEEPHRRQARPTEDDG